MASAAGSVLIAFTPTLGLLALAQQQVGNFMESAVGLFSLPSFPLWSCWLDSKCVISWQVQLDLFSLPPLLHPVLLT